MLKSDIGIYGMGVMGQNISINFANQGAMASVFNRMEDGEQEVTKKFISNQCQDKKIIGTYDIKEFVDSIKQPRKILLMIKAGTAVDRVLNQLIPLLSKGDIVVDGGNSHYLDTYRRLQKMEQHDLYYVGCGISGGEKGALNGIPSKYRGNQPKNL